MTVATTLCGAAVGAAGERLLLIDAFSLIHQAYHAVRELRTSDGTPTNAVYGFASMVLTVLENERPLAVALAFDTPEPTFRHQAYADYKAHRDPPDEALVAQIPLIYELVEAMRWPALRLPGYEADDILATVATRAAAAGWEVSILTADRDLCQLADPQITILATQGRGVSEVHRFDPAGVRERFGVEPSRLPDWKGLVGDSSDNLPGVRGIGPKGATELLAEHGTLEAVLAAADEMKGKRRENLVADAAQARLSAELATVCRDAPVAFELDDLRRRPIDEPRVIELLGRLEFRQLLLRLNPRATSAPAGLDYRSAATPAALEGVERLLAEAAVVGLAWSPEPPGLALSAGDGSAWFVPLAGGHRGGQMALFDQRGDDAASARLKALLEPVLSGRVGYLCHGCQTLYEADFGLTPETGRLEGDTHLAAWLLDPERSDHPPESLAPRLLGWQPPTGESGQLPPGAQAACLRADLARRLAPRLEDELVAARLDTLYKELELPLAPLLGRIMARGIRLDTAAAEALNRELGERIEALRERLTELAGRRFNPDSPKQLGELLFGELGLPAGRKTKTGWSTDAATLQGLLEAHPLIPAVLEYRELTKLRSTYTEAYLSLVDPATERLRTSLNQTGTSTGRLSSSRPNLQNIPVRGGWAERIRELFRAPDGWSLIAADYSQIELRVLAHVTGDARLKQAFRDGLDIHALAAAEIFGVPAEAVEPEMRRRAKVLNFGIAYGIQAHGLSRSLEIGRDEAAALIEAYFARFPGVRQYADDTVARARERGWVQTIFGRRRPVPDLGAANPTVRQAAERVAVNMPIQGAAADIIKRAMLRLERDLAAAGLRAVQLLQVHDELLLEAPDEELPAAVRAVTGAMEQAAELEVPLAVKVETGRRWGSLEPWPGGG